MTLIPEREDRCLMKMAVKSGKTGVFNMAMDTVLWNGKVTETAHAPTNDTKMPHQLRSAQDNASSVGWTDR